MARDVIITPASGLIDFQGSVGVSSATIELDTSGNLNIANPGGDLTLGDTSRDLYIGNGVANVDIIFEQDGEIRGLTGKTLGLGQSDSYVKIVGGLKDGNDQVGVAGSVLTSTGVGISWTTPGVSILYNNINIGERIKTLNFAGTGISSVTANISGIATITIDLQSNLDGGTPTTNYGGIEEIDGGSV